MSVLVRLSALEDDAPGRTLRSAPFAGIEMPTGTDEEADALGRLPPDLQLGSGSWDPFGGVILTWQTLRYELDLSASYLLRTEADGFDAGDLARGEGSFKYRIVPWEELGGGVPTFVHAVLESRVDWRGRSGPARRGHDRRVVLARRTGAGARDDAAHRRGGRGAPVTQPEDRHVDFIARVSWRGSF